jgi:CRP-like cAMP-binding protein
MLTTQLNTPTKKQVDFATLKPVIDFLNGYHPVSKANMRFLLQHTRMRVLKKGEMLQHAGTICTDMCYVMKGVLRGFIMDNGKEVTTWISNEGELVASIRSVFFQVPTKENVEALEDCILVELTYTDLLKVYDTYPEFNIVGRKILEFYYTYAEYRAFICRLSKASDRYEYFIEQNGHLINRIPLMYIASYLNMSIETLSRIRKKLRSKKQPGGQ